MKSKVKAISLILVLSLVLIFAVGCADDSSGFIYVDYKGFRATLPDNMRETSSEMYDVFYTTLATAFGAVRLDREKLEELALDPDMTLEEYTDFFLLNNNIDKEQCSLEYNAKQNAYRFSYSSSNDDVTYYYHYSMILGGSDAIWYVDITCDYEKASGYIPTFEIWANSVKTS